MRYSLLSNNPRVINTIASWIYDEWLKTNPDSSVDKIVSLLSQRIDSSTAPLTIVAYSDDDVPVGTASLTELDMKSHPELSPWLGSVFVPPMARGQGIATELCKRIESEAKRLKYPKIYLFTKDQMPLYEKLGWKIRSTENHKGMNVTIMEKTLS